MYNIIVYLTLKQISIFPLELDKPIEWPALIICKKPIDKNKTKYQEFMAKGITESFKDKIEFNKLKNETFYADVKDIIYAVTIANSFLKGVNRAKEIPIGKDSSMNDIIPKFQFFDPPPSPCHPFSLYNPLR